jgi:hypothetical protein
MKLNVLETIRDLNQLSFMPLEGRNPWRREDHQRESEERSRESLSLL